VYESAISGHDVIGDANDIRLPFINKRLSRQKTAF
jgi:hypothetical protein